MLKFLIQVPGLSSLLELPNISLSKWFMAPNTTQITLNKKQQKKFITVNMKLAINVWCNLINLCCFEILITVITPHGSIKIVGNYEGS